MLKGIQPFPIHGRPTDRSVFCGAGDFRLTTILCRNFNLLLSLGVEVRDSACAPQSFVDAVPFNTLWYLAIPL
jgi:hypothetical protein